MNNNEDRKTLNDFEKQTLVNQFKNFNIDFKDIDNGTEIRVRTLVNDTVSIYRSTRLKVTGRSVKSVRKDFQVLCNEIKEGVSWNLYQKIVKE